MHFEFQILRLPTLNVHGSFLIDQLSKCGFQTACWHFAHSLQERKKTPVRENKCQKRAKQYYRRCWNPFLHFFLKLVWNECAYKEINKNMEEQIQHYFIFPLFSSQTGKKRCTLPSLTI